MIMGRQNQFPNRSIISYRSGSCLLAAKIIRKYKKKNFLIGKDSTQHLVWLSYLKFLDIFGQELREHVINNRIRGINPGDIKFIYKNKMRTFLG